MNFLFFLVISDCMPVLPKGRGAGEHGHTTQPSGLPGVFLPMQGLDLPKGPWLDSGKTRPRT